MTHWAHVNIFPEELIALNREISYHPKLQELLANHQAPEWEVKLAEIANYCEMILNGDYLPEDILRIATILTIKLVKKRERQGGLIVIEGFH